MVAADGVCDICLIGVHFASEIWQSGSPYILATLGGTAVAGIVESLGNFSIVPSVVNRTVRVDIEKLDVLMNLVSELIIAKNSLVSAATTEGITANSAVNEPIEYLESVTTNLHESVMKVRMVPIENVVQKFRRELLSVVLVVQPCQMLISRWLLMIA